MRKKEKEIKNEMNYGNKGKKFWSREKRYGNGEGEVFDKEIDRFCGDVWMG
jgi:hypothetical protein